MPGVVVGLKADDVGAEDSLEDGLSVRQDAVDLKKQQQQQQNANRKFVKKTDKVYDCNIRVVVIVVVVVVVVVDLHICLKVRILSSRGHKPDTIPIYVKGGKNKINTSTQKKVHAVPV